MIVCGVKPVDKSYSWTVEVRENRYLRLGFSVVFTGGGTRVLKGTIGAQRASTWEFKSPFKAQGGPDTAYYLLKRSI